MGLIVVILVILSHIPLASGCHRACCRKYGPTQTSTALAAWTWRASASPAGQLLLCSLSLILSPCCFRATSESANSECARVHKKQTTWVNGLWQANWSVGDAVPAADSIRQLKLLAFSGGRTSSQGSSKFCNSIRSGPSDHQPGLSQARVCNGHVSM